MYNFRILWRAFFKFGSSVENYSNRSILYTALDSWNLDITFFVQFDDRIDGNRSSIHFFPPWG